MNKLIVAGSGIKSVAHLSEETKRIIQKSDKVLYLVNEPLLKEWVQKQSSCSESLDLIYNKFDKRIDAYNAITEYIIEQYSIHNLLSVLFYGHPSVFAEPALSAVKRINNNQGDAIILPAISSMDCLFSDLQIDPGKSGCFSVEATELLVCERKIDICSHLILWQVANLGAYNTSKTNKLNILLEYLLEFYSNKQSVCIYEAAKLPTKKPRIEWIELHKLECASINPISTLYFPPSKALSVSRKYTDLLGIDPKNFTLSKDKADF